MRGSVAAADINLGRTTGLGGVRTLPDLPLGNSIIPECCDGGVLICFPRVDLVGSGEFSNELISISHVGWVFLEAIRSIFERLKNKHIVQKFYFRHIIQELKWYTFSKPE